MNRVGRFSISLNFAGIGFDETVVSDGIIVRHAESKPLAAMRKLAAERSEAVGESKVAVIGDETGRIFRDDQVRIGGDDRVRRDSRAHADAR